FGVARNGRGPEAENVGYGTAQLDVLDAAGDLRLERLAVLELVEHVGSNPPVAVRAEQAVERGAGIVRAGRIEVLMAALRAERCGHLRERQVYRFELDLDAALLLLVGEDLAHAVAGRIARVEQSNLAVLIVGDPRPEA